MIRILALVTALFASTQTTRAETMSAEDFLAQLNANMDRLGPFQAALNDPDPLRALAAMDIMMDSGDPVLIDMVRDNGLISPVPSIRWKAVRAHLATKPVLMLNLTGEDLEDAKVFQQSVRITHYGSVDAEMNGLIAVPVGPYSDEKACYLSLLHKGECKLWATGDNFSILLDHHGTSNNFRVNLIWNEDSTYTGGAHVNGVVDPVPATLTLVQ